MRTITLFQDRLQISLPEDCSPAQALDAAEVFPSAERPQAIFACAGFSRFLTLSLLDKPLGTEETLDAAREMRKLIWSLYPNSILTEAMSLRFGNMKCSGYSYRTGLKEARLFNTMFVVSFESKLLLGTFGCGINDEEGKALLKKAMADAEYVGKKHFAYWQKKTR
jgi:hypothetical protein